MKTKRITALVLCMAMLFCTVFSLAVSSSAASLATLNGVYTVEEGKLTLTVSLGSNPGINTLVARLGYDSKALTLLSVTNGTVFSEANNGSMFEVNVANNPLVLYFEENSIGNITANGVVATLEFTVNEQKEDYGFTLTVDNDNTFGCGEGIVPVDVPFAEPTVKEFTVIPGDVNGDGKVNAVDGNLIKKIVLGSTTPTPAEQAASDLNGDGKVNAVDSNLLKKLILGA